MKIVTEFQTIEEMVAFAQLIANSAIGTPIKEGTAKGIRSLTQEDLDTKSGEMNDLDRLSLEERAEELGIKYRKDIKDSTLLARIDAKIAKNGAKSSEDTDSAEIIEAALDAEDDDDDEDLKQFIKDGAEEEEKEEEEPEEEKEEEVVEEKPKRKRRNSRRVSKDKPKAKEEAEEEEEPAKPSRRRRRTGSGVALPWGA